MGKVRKNREKMLRHRQKFMQKKFIVWYGCKVMEYDSVYIYTTNNNEKNVIKMLKQVFLFVFVGFVLFLLIFLSFSISFIFLQCQQQNCEKTNWITHLFRRRFWLCCCFVSYYLSNGLQTKIYENAREKMFISMSEEMMFVCFMWNIYKIFGVCVWVWDCVTDKTAQVSVFVF